MSTKLEIPKLAGDLDAAAIMAWLNSCHDSFEVHTAVNNAVLTPATQITLAGLKMESPTARAWWHENRDELKALPTWAEFDRRVRERFMPANWKMDALARFYLITQGSAPFSSFVTSLQESRNAIALAGVGFTVSDSVFKNYLLFFCHPILSLRVRAMPSMNYATVRVEPLISLLSFSWDTLVAERLIRPTLAPHSAVSNNPHPPTSSMTLSDKERDTLRAAGGCFRCKRTPIGISSRVRGPTRDEIEVR
jgi:hypothetical protein